MQPISGIDIEKKKKRKKKKGEEEKKREEWGKRSEWEARREAGFERWQKEEVGEGKGGGTFSYVTRLPLLARHGADLTFK